MTGKKNTAGIGVVPDPNQKSVPSRPKVMTAETARDGDMYTRGGIQRDIDRMRSFTRRQDS